MTKIQYRVETRTRYPDASDPDRAVVYHLTSYGRVTGIIEAAHRWDSFEEAAAAAEEWELTRYNAKLRSFVIVPIPAALPDYNHTLEGLMLVVDSLMTYGEPCASERRCQDLVDRARAILAAAREED